MPTGTPTRDLVPRLHAAALGILLRDGAAALTSRAVTAEAGVAKGILHRHFDSFDAFLATLVLSHIERIDQIGDELRASADSATVSQNLAQALEAAIDPVTAGLTVLICSRPALLRRLELVTPTGIPIVAEIVRHVAAYLTAERGLGRVALGTDVDALATTLVGGAHLSRLGVRYATGADAQPVLELTRVILPERALP